MRAFQVGTWEITPTMEMFNTFNSANNIDPLTTPALFDFNGFLRTGVGDPRRLQLAVKVTFWPLNPELLWRQTFRFAFAFRLCGFG